MGIQEKRNTGMITPKLKIKKCKVCAERFQQQRLLQSVCSPLCAVDYANTLKEKNNRLEALKTRRETKEKLDGLKTRSEYLKEAQRFFNQFIRIRDANNPCISCNRWHTGQYHAGHYRSVGSAPNLRFNELNCHKQCSVCNNHLSGNQLNYREGLIRKIGLEAVERLNADNEAKHYTIEEIKAIKVKYKQLTKELKDARG